MFRVGCKGWIVGRLRIHKSLMVGCGDWTLELYQCAECDLMLALFIRPCLSRSEPIYISFYQVLFVNVTVSQSTSPATLLGQGHNKSIYISSCMAVPQSKWVNLYFSLSGRVFQGHCESVYISGNNALPLSRSVLQSEPGEGTPILGHGKWITI